MRTRLAGMAFLGLAVCLAPARADDAAEARAVVEKAVKAHGGADNLTRARTLSRSVKGTLSLGMEVTFSGEEVHNLPAQFRSRIEVGKLPLLRVVNGDKGWKTSGGVTVELEKGGLAEIQEEAWVLYVVTLAPLLKDDLELRPLPEAKVHGKACVGVKVTGRGRPDLALYFDKDTGMLTKLARKAREAGLMVDKDYYYSDPKDVDGAKLPGKDTVHVNGRLFYEVNYSDYKVLRKVDESLFSRP